MGEKEEAIRKIQSQLDKKSTGNQPESLEQQEASLIETEDSGLLDQIEMLNTCMTRLEKDKQCLQEENNRLKGIISDQEATMAFLQNELGSLKEQSDLVEEKSAEEDNELVDENDDEIILLTNNELLPEESKVITDIIVSKDGSIIENEGISDITKRTIDAVIDIENGEEIKANDFFRQPESIIFKMRTELQKAIYLERPKWVCKYCGQMVKISGRKLERGMATFFSHLRDSDDCDCKTTTGRTKCEIEREKYARCNEGERHKELKQLLVNYLSRTEGVSDIQTEHTVKTGHPILRWRRPDIEAHFQGKDIVFELQLSTTFVSVMTERDLFYRLNKMFIIWVFNFDDDSQYVDLNNMMIKDVYYNNKRNIFIFDEAAQEESKRRNQLVLKCNWLKPNDEWMYPNENSSNNLGGIFITLADLHFDSTYKPYYVDAETLFWEQHPELKKTVINIEEENQIIISELDKKAFSQQQEKEEKKEWFDNVQDAFELDKIYKYTQKYLIGTKEGKYGLITTEGEIGINFIYDSITSRKQWIEAIKKQEIDLYEKNTYRLIDTKIRKISPLDDNLYMVGKMLDNNFLLGLMGKKGELLTEIKYSEIKQWSVDKIRVMEYGKQALIDRTGHEIITGYDFIGDLDENERASVLFKGISGYIDAEGKQIYTENKILKDGWEKVKTVNGWGIIKEGKEYVPCSFDEIASYRGEMIGLDGMKIEMTHLNLDIDCPLCVKFARKNDRGMLVFKVGEREAFMNIRQQQKAKNVGLEVENLSEMYVSYVNLERQLLYLSVVPVRPIPTDISYSDLDYVVGEKYSGTILRKNLYGLIVKFGDGKSVFLHQNTLGNYSLADFNNGQLLELEKIGYDRKYGKHIWKILSMGNK